MKLWGNGIFFSNFALKLFVLVTQIFHPDTVIFIKRKQLRKGFVSTAGSSCDGVTSPQQSCNPISVQFGGCVEMSPCLFNTS